MTEQYVEEIISDIKKELRSSMNGILSARMRESGTPYRLVFGVELPRLQTIASEFEPGRVLAQELWNQHTIRECQILAVLLMPVSEMLPEVADIWLDEAPSAEVVQIMVLHLLSHESWAMERAFAWIASDSFMRQLAGFLLLARMLQTGSRFNDRAKDEILDQAQALSEGAALPLRKAINAVLCRLEEA